MPDSFSTEIIKRRGKPVTGAANDAGETATA